MKIYRPTARRPPTSILPLRGYKFKDSDKKIVLYAILDQIHKLYFDRNLYYSKVLDFNFNSILIVDHEYVKIVPQEEGEWTRNPEKGRSFDDVVGIVEKYFNLD